MNININNGFYTFVEIKNNPDAFVKGDRAIIWSAKKKPLESCFARMAKLHRVLEERVILYEKIELAVSTKDNQKEIETKCMQVENSKCWKFIIFHAKNVYGERYAGKLGAIRRIFDRIIGGLFLLITGRKTKAMKFCDQYASFVEQYESFVKATSDSQIKSEAIEERV